MLPALLAATLLLAAPAGTGLQARGKKKAAAAALALKKDTADTAYGKLVKNATKTAGLFTVIQNKKQNKVYFEIPDSLFGKHLLLTNRVARTSDTHDFVAGQAINGPFLLMLAKDAQKVYLTEVQDGSVVGPSDPIAASFGNNFVNPVFKGFKIEATNGGSVVIDVTAFFGANEKSISPIKDSSPLGKLLGGKDNLKGTFVADASNIQSVKAFARNIEIETLMSFTTQPLGKPYSVVVHRSLALLPDNPMPLRLQDNRVGYFYTERNVYSSDEDRVTKQPVIHRWRIEPDSADMARYLRGELVEPKRKIVFYVDSAFPPKWRSAVKQGILDWNAAFEAAGFKNVMVARDYPTPAEDPDFDPDNMGYNCVKYAATRTANAMGPSHVDPRTGEILNAEVIWYHNVVSLLHDWRFVQTAAVDSRVRTKVFADSLMWESMRYVASHEIGHTLGLMHNMGASFAFPVDSLRSPSFTRRYGTTPSIMDYARNNFVAQPGDVERGVKLTPPILGVYDIHAINWGYRLIPGARTPQDEKPVLDSWIAEHEGDPMYEFGAQQILGTVDPTDQTEDLGDDHIKAGNYGISNLKILMRNLEEWNMDRGERYDEMENMYREIVGQYTRYLRHVLPYIGGIRYEEVRQGDGKATSKHYISREKQHEAMLWLLDQARTYGDWLTDKDLIGKFEINLNANDKLLSTVVGGLMNAAVLYRIQEGGQVDPANNYVLDDYMDDLREALFKAPQGGKLPDVEQNLQATAITLMMNNSGLASKAKSSTASLADEEAAAAADLRDGQLPGCCAIGPDGTAFARINFGLPTLPKDRLGALMTGQLRQVLRLYQARRGAATGSTRDFYDYQILLIERLFAN